MLSIDILDSAALILSILIIGYSAYHDLKKREVSDRVWILYLPLAVIMLAFRIILKPELLMQSLISIICTSLITFLMFYFGLFGGADFKGLVCLSVALPTNPSIVQSILGWAIPIFPLSVLYNAYLFSVSIILYSLIKNLIWILRKGRVLFNDQSSVTIIQKIASVLTGYKTDFDSLQKKVYLYPMEEISIQDNVFSRRLKLFTDANVDRDGLVKTLGESLSDSEKQEIWASPGIPLLIFIWIALISCSFLGDILLWMAFRIMPFILR